MKRQVESFRRFHGRDPDSVTVTPRFWFPGELVLVGTALDTGYRIDVHASEKEKDQEYVHDHKDGVKLYRRARHNERHDKTMRPRTICWPLGRWLGATYLGDDGERHEVSGGRLRAISPSEKILFAADPKGVRYVIMGGRFRITDWMYD